MTGDPAPLLRRHAALIRRIALAWCRHASDRDELAQEIAVELWRASARYDGRTKESTWVYRIALNVAISFGRRQARQRRHRADVDVHTVAIARAEPDAGEDLQRLLVAIDGLRALDKALVLLFLEGNDHAETAAVLGITVGNAATRLHRIKGRLRDALGARRDPAEDDHGTR